MDKYLQPIKSDNALMSSAFERKIQSKVGSIIFNEELLKFMKSNVEAQKKINDKLYLLYLFKRIFATSVRNPEQAHFYLFEDEYLLDIKTYNIEKWLEVEIEFYKNVQSLEIQASHQGLTEAKAELSKQWVTGEEIKEIFKWSRTTLNRRIAEGMPCHAKGKTKFFNLEEVGEWLRESED